MSQATSTRGATSPLHALLARLDSLPAAIAEIPLRLGVALVFWRSGQTKLDNWDLTVMLFREEYQVPLVPAELAAYLATAVEHAAPIMLLLGLGTRFAAAAMLGMALVIQLFVYPSSYPDHLLWLGPLLYLLLRGPGVLSLDHAIRRRFGPA